MCSVCRLCLSHRISKETIAMKYDIVSARGLASKRACDNDNLTRTLYSILPDILVVRFPDNQTTSSSLELFNHSILSHFDNRINRSGKPILPRPTPAHSTRRSHDPRQDAFWESLYVLFDNNKRYPAIDQLLDQLHFLLTSTTQSTPF